MVGEDNARARNLNLNEDLGRIDYVFSDKTGTLTSNDMQLRMINMKGVTYGDEIFQLENFPKESRGEVALSRFDDRIAKSVAILKLNNMWSDLVRIGGSDVSILKLPASNPHLINLDATTKTAINTELNNLAQNEIYDNISVNQSLFKIQNSLRQISNNVKPDVLLHAPSSKSRVSIRGEYLADYILGLHAVDFWTNICICHNLIIESDNSGDGNREDDEEMKYQGPSPDEVALVEAGRNLGFVFKERTMDSITLNMQVC